MGLGGQRHALANLTPGEKSGTRFTERRVGPRASLDGCGKSSFYPPPAPTEIGFPDRPGRSESLCRLSYPGSLKLSSRALKSGFFIARNENPLQNLLVRVVKVFVEVDDIPFCIAL
jgi:hypothetical protein